MVVIKGKIVTDIIRTGYLFIKEDRIENVDYSDKTIDCIDFSDHYIVPGYIDLHMHGIHEHLVDNGINDLEKIVSILPQYGVTGFLPTVAPKNQGEDAAFIKTLSCIKPDGAQIFGFHLEGPFLKLTGSLSGKAISNPEPARVQSLIDACTPFKAIFSISPDVEGITNVIPLMAANNTPVFMTHTAATVSETIDAIKAGASHATHFYDVFPCPPVTEPGVRPCGIVEAVLADENVSVDFILDGVHVDPIAVKMALACKAKGQGSVCLITDSNIGAGLEPGKFIFGDTGEVYFEYKGAPARMSKNGGLAGSGLTMDQALRNAIQMLQLTLPEAVTLTSTNPAKVLRIDDTKGSLKAGYDADFAILSPQLEVMETWVGGQKKYAKK